MEVCLCTRVKGNPSFQLLYKQSHHNVKLSLWFLLWLTGAKCQIAACARLWCPWSPSSSESHPRSISGVSCHLCVLFALRCAQCRHTTLYGEKITGKIVGQFAIFLKLWCREFGKGKKIPMAIITPTVHTRSQSFASFLFGGLVSWCIKGNQTVTRFTWV